MTWNFFESGHGKGAAGGIGGSLKRQADNFVATGRDIIDVSQFFSALKGRSKTKLFFVTDDDIAQILEIIPSGIVPLKGTMQVQQLFAQKPGKLSYKILSCFCSKFCSCFNTKTYRPLPEEDVTDTDSRTSEDLDQPPADIINIIAAPRKRFYDAVYSPSFTSEGEDDHLLDNLKQPSDVTLGISYELPMDKVHPLLIKNGTHLLVKVISERKVEYTYLAIAKSDIDEEGDVRVMFYMAVGNTGKLFKLVKTDVSDLMFDILFQLLKK